MLSELRCSLIYISNILRGKTKSPPSIKWGLLLPKISPSPRRTTVFEFKHGIASKAPFEQLLDRGRSLFPEVFDPKCILPGVEVCRDHQLRVAKILLTKPG